MFRHSFYVPYLVIYFLRVALSSFLFFILRIRNEFIPTISNKRLLPVNGEQRKKYGLMHSRSKLNETVLSTIGAEAATVAASVVNCLPIEPKRHLFAVKSVPESCCTPQRIVCLDIPLFSFFLRSSYLSSPHFSCLFFISGFVFLIPSLLIVFVFFSPSYIFRLRCCSGDVLFIIM